MRKFYVILFLFSGYALVAKAATKEIGFKRLPSGIISKVPAVETEGTMAVPVTAICKTIGFRWRWHIFKQKLSCFKDDMRLVFNQDGSVCLINGTPHQLLTPPFRKKGRLYISIPDAVEVFNCVSDNALKWDSTSQTLVVTNTPYSILSVDCDVKQNGTLVAISLLDSLPFEYTFFYPNLTINFFGGSVDKDVLKKLAKIGVVDSVFGVQYDQSAQISLILAKEIEEPQVDYFSEKKKVLVSLRPKNQPKIVDFVSPAIETQSIKTIVIDPGHGGKDPGAIGQNGVKEKDVVLAVALKLRDMLKEKSDMSVYLTRDKDVFIPLRERTNLANDKKADLFVSIHADAIPGSRKRKEKIKGYKVYFLSHAKNEEDKLVAMRENAVIKLEETPRQYDNLQNVLIDLAGNEYLRESQELGILLDQHFDSQLKKIKKLHRGVGQANFWVLNGAYMPSVLIELGFLSNSDEAKLLSDKKFQKKMATSICNALLNFNKKYGAGL